MWHVIHSLKLSTAPPYESSERRFRRWGFLPLALAILAVAALALGLFAGGSAPAEAQSSFTVRVKPGAAALNVSWTQLADTATAYTVEWKSGSESYDSTSSTRSATQLGTFNSYQITGLTPGTAYTVRVRASVTDVGFVYSNEATATPYPEDGFPTNAGGYAVDSAKDFDTLAAAGNTNPQAIWSDGTTMWVADNTDNKLYAYNMATKARDAAKDFDTLAAAGNTNLRGIWSDGAIMLVVDGTDDKIYAYNLATKAREPRDFNTLAAAGNTNPQGIWSDGTTVWVVDDTDDKIYAYSMATKARDSRRDFDTLTAADNHNPGGIWSDGHTMWVVDDPDNKIYAYNLGTTLRDPAKDFSGILKETLNTDGTARSQNSNPFGIWSDADKAFSPTMWVTDDTDNKIYAYRMSFPQGIYVDNIPADTEGHIRVTGNDIRATGFRTGPPVLGGYRFEKVTVELSREHDIASPALFRLANAWTAMHVYTATENGSAPDQFLDSLGPMSQTQLGIHEAGQVHKTFTISPYLDPPSFSNPTRPITW